MNSDDHGKAQRMGRHLRILHKFASVCSIIHLFTVTMFNDVFVGFGVKNGDLGDLPILLGYRLYIAAML